jgi:hypothetical protein
MQLNGRTNAKTRSLSAVKPQRNRGKNNRNEAQKAQKVGEEALSSAFLLFSASAIASLSDQSLKGNNRESTEGRRRSSAEPHPRIGCRSLFESKNPGQEKMAAL